MKKTDSRWNDTRRIKSSGNVFVDLGFDPAEAEVLKLRAEVMLRLEQLVKERGWTQTEAARHLGVTQPRVSRLVKGKWQDFSLDMLLTLAMRAGLKPTLRLALTTRQRFHAASTIAGFVIGTAADLGHEPPEEVVEGRVSRDQFLGRYADAWRALDPADFPFVHEIADEFDGHDDAEQFRAGLDLILAGLRLQAGRRSS